MPIICITGLTHTYQSYIHFSHVLGTGGTQRQSTVPHGKDIQHGNCRGKVLGSREESGAIIIK